MVFRASGDEIIHPDDVLSFWFADYNRKGADWAPHLNRWFECDPKFDRVIRNRFRSYIERAGRGELDAWKTTARGRLALIILLDQFARNTFRSDSRAFTFDAYAVELCLEGLAANADHDLAPIERLFFYLPLLHSEKFADQERGIACFQRLASECGRHWSHEFRKWLRVARHHRRIIAWFGRFPHRNAALGRRSTTAERIFLLFGHLRRWGHHKRAWAFGWRP